MVEQDDERGHLRVSDADRQRVVDRLSRACGDGMISLDEFAEQAGVAYAAITRAELDAVTRDLHLPVVASMPPAPSVVPEGAIEPAAGEAPVKAKRRWIVAIMSGEDRKGRWRAARRTGAFAMMGGVELDLRDAQLDGDEIEITAWAIMGGVSIIVPEGIPVESSGFILMGGRSNRIKDVPPVPGAPVIRVKGYGMWGGIDVRSKPPRRAGEDDSMAEMIGRVAGRALSDATARYEERAERHRDRDRRHDRPDRGGGGGRRSGVPVPPVPTMPIPPLPFSPFGDRSGGWVGGSQETEAPGSLVTVVCTDIVGSTRYADTLGDQRWRGVLQTHNALVREQLAVHGGREIKTSGDGFLVTFTSARRAVQFSVDLQDRLADYRAGHPETPLEVRIGVHAGEVEHDGDDLVGRNVSLACRLCDAAAPGEVLTSSVVADLADSASDLSFGPAREHRLAGIDRPINAHVAARR